MGELDSELDRTKERGLGQKAGQFRVAGSWGWSGAEGRSRAERLGNGQEPTGSEIGWAEFQGQWQVGQDNRRTTGSEAGRV